LDRAETIRQMNGKDCYREQDDARDTDERDEGSNQEGKATQKLRGDCEPSRQLRSGNADGVKDRGERVGAVVPFRKAVREKPIANDQSKGDRRVGRTLRTHRPPSRYLPDKSRHRGVDQHVHGRPLLLSPLRRRISSAGSGNGGGGAQRRTPREHSVDDEADRGSNEPIEESIVPIAEISRAPTPTPTLAPTMSSIARRSRWPSIASTETMAATGANNGAPCPRRCTATNQEGRGQGRLEQRHGKTSPRAQAPCEVLAKARPGRACDPHAAGTG